MTNLRIHRWFRLGVTLRTALIAAMLATLFVVWRDYQRKWIYDRQDFLARHVSLTDGEMPAPWTIRLFGAQGYKRVSAYGSEDEKERAKELFPEAIVQIQELTQEAP